MKQFSKNLIRENAPLKEALQKIGEVPQTSTLFVLNEQDQMVGTLTDGDIRRGLLAEKPLDASVKEFMFRAFRYLSRGQFSIDQIRELREKRIHLIPILNEEKKIIRIVNLSEKRSLLPADAIIMAGGKGTRLRPMTLTTPKPLLKIGGKPIIEYNIDRLNLYGVHHINISIKYLGEQIQDYFKDGSTKDLSIKYVTEEQPLGTIGAVQKIPKIYNNYLIVMNSDVLTNINFEDLFQELITHDGDMIVATYPYEVKIPYGILETEEQLVASLKEKPTYTYYSNAGIYILKKEVIDYIPKGKHFNATDLIDTLIKEKKRVLHYPILGYWLDIGKPNDFEKAQKDINHIPF